MKLSFSTLGCPGWSFDDILYRAKQYRFDGVGFRGVLGQLDLNKVPEFAPDRLADSRARIEGAGLTASMALTSAKLIVPDPEIEDHLALAETHIEIAAGLGAPAIRVFGGQFPVGLSHDAAVFRAAERLRRLGDIGARHGVAVLLETHDDFTDPALMRRVMEATGHPAVGVLWDIHHPFRILGQPVEAAWAALAPWVQAVDVKDSRADFAARLGYRYIETGTGEVPLPEALRLLRAGGYDGWLSFEWEKLWHADLDEPETAFPAFVAYMRGLLAIP